MKMFENKKLFYFLCVYVSFFAVMVFTAANSQVIANLLQVLTVVMLLVFILVGNDRHLIDFEKTIIILVSLMFGTLLLVHERVQEQYSIIYTLLLLVVLIVAAIYFLQNHSGLDLGKWISQNGIVFLIILLFVILSVEVIDSWMMWDSLRYTASVESMVRNFDTELAGIYGLYFAGHASLGYSLWIMFFQLFKEGTKSIQVADIFLAGISIFAYYQILRKLLGNKFSNKILSLATIPYAFSPFVLGMVGNFNLDSATMYFAVIFIACSLYHYEILELVLAFCFCFTKEPAIIYYVGYIVIKTVCGYMKNNRFNLFRLTKYVIGDIKNYIYSLPVILWGILFLLNSQGGWGSSDSDALSLSDSGINCFGISNNVIVMKMKQIFLLNFNWVFWTTIILGLILLIVRKRKIVIRELDEIIPIFGLGILVCFFGCVYITWTHVRYIVPMIPVLYLAATLVISKMEKGGYGFYIWNGVLSVVLLIQSFYTIDPVTCNVFETISVGNNKVYSTHLKEDSRFRSKRVFCDSIVYNRQYMYWQETLIEALNRVGYDNNTMIVFPDDINCTTHSLIGISWERWPVWNMTEGKLDHYDEHESVPDYCVYLDVCSINEFICSPNLINKDYIAYILPRWVDVDMNFLQDKKIVKQGEVDNKGYNIRYIVMTLEDNLPLADGSYIVSPKQDGTLGLATDGGNGGKVFLGEEMRPLSLAAIDAITYHFILDEYQVALDVPNARIDNNGTVQVWSTNSTNGQKWILEEVDGYYMICFNNYALTYNIDDKSVRLTPKTGEDNQLWLFTK